MNWRDRHPVRTIFIGLYAFVILNQINYTQNTNNIIIDIKFCRISQTLEIIWYSLQNLSGQQFFAFQKQVQLQKQISSLRIEICQLIHRQEFSYLYVTQELVWCLAYLSMDFETRSIDSLHNNDYYQQKQINKDISLKLNPKMIPPIVTYHLSTTNEKKIKKTKISKNNNINRSQSQSQDQEKNPLFEDSLIDDHLSASNVNSIVLKSNQNGGYYEQLAKIKKFKGKNKDYFEHVIVNQIKESKIIPQQRKSEVIDLYRAICVFSSANVLFYKRLYKHELQFSLVHGDDSKNIYNEPEEKLPRLKELMQGHLKVGAGIQNIRSFYQNNNLIKDQYSTLLHSLLRVVFSKVRDFIIFKHPKLSWLLNTIKPGTARFNYSNAVSISLLHANKEFSPSMNQCYEKIVKVVYFYGGVQDIYIEDIQALFQLLRERNEQHLVPMRLEEEKKPRSQGRKYSPFWEGFIPYVPYAQPQCDVDFQVQKPSGDEVFEKFEGYITRNWTLKFERYLLALYMKYQNFLDLKQVINSEYHNYLGKELELQQLRGKFEITMKKLVIYLQLQLYYIIRRTNTTRLQNYKIDFSTKKFMTLNKNQKRAIFTSQNAKNCRMFLIDYYLNNYQRKSKSYKMSLINYRLSYISRTIDAIITFLNTKLGECGILIQSQLQKEDTYPLKLISNAYFSIIKSILKQILILKSIKTHDQGQKMVKNPNTRRSLYHSAEIDKVFDDLRPDDLMEIQNMYLIRRNKSLIAKRNPKMFPRFKLAQTLQLGLVEEQWDNLMKIMDRRGMTDPQEQQQIINQKFQSPDGVDIQDEELLQIESFKKGKSGQIKGQIDKNYNQKFKEHSAKSQTSKRYQSNTPKNNQNISKTVQQTEDEETRKRDKAEFMKVFKQSDFIKTELMILKINAEKDNFRKYYK